MTPEQKQRIEQIENGDQPWRKTAYELGDVLAGHESDIGFLLSLVKREQYVEEAYDDIANAVATSMRSACLGAVKLLWSTDKSNDYNSAINDAVKELESVSIQEQDGQTK